jgi:hypothetical protein
LKKCKDVRAASKMTKHQKDVLPDMSETKEILDPAKKKPAGASTIRFHRLKKSKKLKVAATKTTLAPEPLPKRHILGRNLTSM